MVTLAGSPPQLVGGVGAGEGNGGEAVRSLSERETGYAHRRCGIMRAPVGVEGRAVVTGVSIFELIDDVRRKDVGLFDDADGRLRCEGLAEVVGDRADVASGGRLADWIGAGLATDGRDKRQRDPSR